MLRDTLRELEMRIETQKQTLAARDDSIKKMVEMVNNKGIATKIIEDERIEMERVKTRNIELEARLRHYENVIESKEKDIIKVSCLLVELSFALSSLLVAFSLLTPFKTVCYVMFVFCPSPAPFRCPPAENTPHSSVCSPYACAICFGPAALVAVCADHNALRLLQPTA